MEAQTGNLKDVIEYLKREGFIRNQQEFVERVGYDRTFISNLQSKGKAISPRLADKISLEYPIISNWYLRTGQGPINKIEPSMELPRQRLSNTYIKNSTNVATEGSQVTVATEKYNEALEENIRLREERDEWKDKYISLLDKYTTLLEKSKM